jgi:hypothetical protein
MDQIRSIGANNTAYDGQGNAGACGTHHQQRTAANLVDPEECWEGAEAVDNSIDAGSEK